MKLIALAIEVAFKSHAILPRNHNRPIDVGVIRIDYQSKRGELLLNSFRNSFGCRHRPRSKKA